MFLQAPNFCSDKLITICLGNRFQVLSSSYRRIAYVCLMWREGGGGMGGLLNVIAVCIRDHVVELLYHQL